MLLAGLAGLLKIVPLLLISLIGLASLFLIQPTRSILLSVPGYIQEAREELVSWWREFPGWLRWFTMVFVVVSAVRFTFLTLALPPFVWDSLTYHLTNVAEWTQRGGISLFETSMERIYTPANFETLALWFTVFIHHDAIVEAAGIPAYILALLSIYSIGRSLGLRSWSAWFSGLAYLSTPALLIATTGTKNDPHMAAYYLGLLAILLYAFTSGAGEKRGRIIGPLIAALLMSLLAFGTKAYFIHILPGIVLIAVIGVRPVPGWKRVVNVFSNVRAEWQQCSRAMRAALFVLLVAGMVLGLYWNLRNWALKGNPFYPYGVRVEQAQILEGADRTAALDLIRLEENTKSLVWKFGDRQGRISPDLTDSTGWGWVIYSLGLPALLWGMIRRRDLRVLFAGFALSLVIIFMSIRPSPWNMRYILWFPAVFTLALGALIDWAWPRVPGLGRALVVPVLIGVGLNIIVVWNYGRIGTDDLARMLELPLGERSSAALSLNMSREYANTLELVSPEAVLGYNVSENGFIYPLYRPDFSQEIVYVPIGEDGDCTEIARAMTVRGTRYLFVAPVHTSDEVLSVMHRCGESGEHIQEWSFNLYVLKD
jgi:hypothetical protein